MYSSDTIEGGASRERVELGTSNLRDAARRLLARGVSARTATWCCIVLALCLLSPALWTGLVADDYLHELMLRDDPGLRGLSHRPLDLFRFADGRPGTVSALTNEGVFPWWADPKVLLAFFRPLSSFTHFIDHSLWPSAPLLMHLHSMLWFGILIAIVAAVYRRFGALGHGSSLALLLFAIDDAHAPIVGWVANRNALISLCFALPALLLHDRRRRSRSVHGMWLAPLLFSLGLLAGEVAVSVFAYLVAYAVCLDRGRWYRRLGALLPYVAVLVIWKLACVLLGYGASGSGLYVDPLREPIAFTRLACERLPVLGLGLLAGPFADFWELYPVFSPWLRVWVMLLALLVLGGFALVLRPLLRRHARLQFWAMGACLSLVPLCATFPHDRLLLGPGIGAMAVIAAMIEMGWARRQRLLPALGMGALVIVHLIAAPLLAPLRAANVGQFSQLLRATARTLPSGPAVREQTLILLNPPLDPFASYLPVYREAAGEARPRQQLWLATGISDVLITRIDAHAISVHPDGGFLSSSMQLMLRNKARGFMPGERVLLDGASIEVTELTDDGRPLEIVARFDRELSDPSLVWLRWQRVGYAPFQLPAMGKAVVLPKADIGYLLFDS